MKRYKLFWRFEIVIFTDDLSFDWGRQRDKDGVLVYELQRLFWNVYWRKAP